MREHAAGRLPSAGSKHHMANQEHSEVDALLDSAEEIAREVSAGPAAVEPAHAVVPDAFDPDADSTASEQTLDQALPPEVRRILKIEAPVIVQLAEREMSMEEVLDLNVGSIIQFEKPFDAELELMVTRRRIGYGHAVKVGENFGLRITRIGSLYDTIKALTE